MFSLRFVEMGGTLWTDPNITFGHFGTNGNFGNYHESLLKTPEEMDKIRKEQAEAQKPATPKEAAA